MLWPVSRRLGTSSCITPSIPSHYITNNDDLRLGGLPAGPCHTEAGNVHLKMLHQEDTNDLQLMQIVCLKLGWQISETIFNLVDDRLIPARSPVSNSPTPLFSIIDPQNTNWNDNQWRRLDALSNPANEGNIKKRDVSLKPAFVVVGSIYMEDVGVSACCVQVLVC